MSPEVGDAQRGGIDDSNAAMSGPTKRVDTDRLEIGARSDLTEAMARAMLAPEPLLVVPEGSMPEGLILTWREKRLSEESSAVVLYLLPKGADPAEGDGDLARRGGWVLYQSLGDPQKIELTQPQTDRHLRKVRVRGHPGRQFETRFSSSSGDDSKVCMLYWDEPAQDVTRRYQMLSPASTCDGLQLELANRLTESRGP